MEGFLQSLKFENPDMQAQVCKLVGYAAKKRGKFKNWKEKGVLYWQGQEFSRRGSAYQELLDRAYEALAKNPGFRDALLATGDAVLEHSIGRTSESETILTRKEFCGRLMKLRTRIRNGEL